MTLAARIHQGEFYQGYSYAYPHKTAYRHFDPIDLTTVWQQQNTQQLFLYAHIPFCEMRCGFCNLFTTANPKNNLTQKYLDALARQAKVTHEALGTQAKFSRFALGGGTPTYLTASELEQLFNAFACFQIDYQIVPSSIEASPLTITSDRLEVLKAHHLKRVSIGVQSFINDEVRSVGRGQKSSQVFQAVERVRQFEFPILNLDLIYGLAHQTPETWGVTLNVAISLQAEEIFLYPLYVRPLTGIGKFGRNWDDERLSLYRQGRDLLLNAGYEQVSMRYFRKPVAESDQVPSYCCQQDGMVGLGCGARSYTTDLHYSSEYAVGRSGVKAILNDFSQRTDDDFRHVSYGFKLDHDTQKRRFIIQSILHQSGLVITDYQRCFNSLPLQDYPQLAQLFELGLVSEQGQCWRLTEKGFELADLIGPWLYAPDIEQRMHSYVLK